MKLLTASLQRIIDAGASNFPKNSRSNLQDPKDWLESVRLRKVQSCSPTSMNSSGPTFPRNCVMLPNTLIELLSRDKVHRTRGASPLMLSKQLCLGAVGGKLLDGGCHSTRHMQRAKKHNHRGHVEPVQGLCVEIGNHNNANAEDFCLDLCCLQSSLSETTPHDSPHEKKKEKRGKNEKIEPSNNTAKSTNSSRTQPHRSAYSQLTESTSESITSFLHVHRGLERAGAGFSKTRTTTTQPTRRRSSTIEELL